MSGVRYPTTSQQKALKSNKKHREQRNGIKHVKKNQYEEELFRCEDKRFELDVVIDSNAAAIAVLELINAKVQQNELSKTISINTLKEVPCSVDSVSAGVEATNTIAFMLDAAALSTAHVNAIVRAYGEHGAN